MKHPFSAKIVTANHLISGEVIYRTVTGDWSRLHRDAELITNETQAEQVLAVAQRQSDVVGAYLAGAQLEAGHPAPLHPRETFRTLGPSNYPHGKQEVTNHV